MSLTPGPNPSPAAHRVTARWAPLVLRRPATALTAAVLGAVLGAGCSGLTGGAGSTNAATPGSTHRSTAVVGQPAPGSTGAGGAVQLLAVSCPSATRCWAVGNTGPAGASLIEATADGGQTWHTQLGGSGRAAPTGSPAPATTLNAVSCWDGQHCLAAGAVVAPQLGAALLATGDGGRSWGQVPGPSGAVDVVGVQCLGGDSGSCTVLASSGGGGYFSASLALAQITAGVPGTSTPGPSTPGTSAPGSGTGSPVTGAANPTSTTGPAGTASWTVGGQLPPGFGGARGLACPSAGSCLVAGDVTVAPGHADGAVARTTDGGTTWSLATVPTGIGVLHAIDCLTTSCLAVGTTSTVTSGVAPGHGLVLGSSDGGATFSLMGSPTALDDGLGTSCLDADTCAVVGTSFTATIPAIPRPAVVTTTDLGARFATLALQYVPTPLVAVACGAPTTCVAVGGDVLARFALPAGHPGGAGVDRRP